MPGASCDGTLGNAARITACVFEEDMMRKAAAAIAVAGSLLAGIAAATPALAASRPITLLCSPSTNGGTLVNGVCVLPRCRGRPRSPIAPGTRPANQAVPLSRPDLT